MIKNKKPLTAILLMLVYALLMFQEIAVDQVLCYKENGDVHLELAVFSLKCNCFEIHNHPITPQDSHKTNDCSKLSCQFVNCIDQPFNTSWLERDITPNPSGSLFKYKNNPNGHIINIKATEALTRRSSPDFLIKLPKFLSNSYLQEKNTILRC